ncbi:PepSY domain-containing protein [Tolypothrix campylonemoides VB511288]|nr:PepSY domain-containing protein [Tolypothrix campylonemoides VB511288]
MRLPAIPRRFWFTLHSWVGLKLSLFMGFILLTGTLATLAHEIDWLLTPAMRVSPVDDDAPRASWGTLAANAARAQPGWTVERIGAPIDPWFAARVTISRGEQTRYVHLHPATGAVQGTSGFFNVHRFLRNTHRHLMLPVKYGVPIVCSLALLLAVSLVSSLSIYKRWWRGFFAWPRRDNRRRFWGDLHRLGGVWSLWFVLLMAVTGVWYLVEELGAEAPRFDDLGRGGVEAAQPFAPDARRIDALVAAAQARWPSLRIAEVMPPRADDDALVVNGQADAILVRPRANAVGVRADSGAVTGVIEGHRLSLHQRISEAADPLHFGTFGGLPTKLLWFAFGLVLTGLSFSGAVLYALRVRAAWREDRVPDAAPAYAS